jgi:hypothetical protein
MFGVPEKKSDARLGDYYTVPITAPVRVGVRVMFSKSEGGILPNVEAIAKFTELRKTVLRELTKERRMFKHAPSLESLEAITPVWGFILMNGAPQLSPYTTFLPQSQTEAFIACIVDFELKRLEISRSTIRPVFQTVYLEAAMPLPIEFDWGSDAAVDADADEIEEVSDVALDAAEESGGGGGSVVRLADPAAREREKEEAKARIRAAFLAAEEARATAEELAAKFHDTYDLSDSESAFSEWIGSDSESDA